MSERPHLIMTKRSVLQMMLHTMIYLTTALRRPSLTTALFDKRLMRLLEQLWSLKTNGFSPQNWQRLMSFSFLISRWFGTSKSFLDERDLQTPGKSSRKTSFRAPVYRSIFICISAPGYRQSYKYQVLLNKGRFFKQQWEGHIKFSLEQRGSCLQYVNLSKVLL